MSIRIALEIAAELDVENGILFRQAAAVIRAQHAEVEAVYRALAPLQVKSTLLESVTVGPDTVADWIPQYLARVSARKLADETYHRIRRSVESFAAAHGQSPVSEIGTSQVADYLATIDHADGLWQIVEEKK